jgi:hypothetical protein
VDVYDETMGQRINTFWTEFEDFQSRIGSFADRNYIFNSHHVDLKEGRVFIWHKKESLCYTEEFGRFACRVTSKILGIGTAERSWGDVKHLKTNKRAHLSGDRVMKQATIFGASCIEEATIKRRQDNDINAAPIKLWRDDDFVFSSDDEQIQLPKKRHSRIFKAFYEDWEKDTIRTRDAVNEAKLLKKYGGLSWQDDDNNEAILTSDKENMHWARLTKTGGGYCVRACDSSYRDDDSNKESHVEPWEILVDLIHCIKVYYKTHRNEGVQVVEQEEVEVVNNEDDELNDNDQSQKKKTPTKQTKAALLASDSETDVE